MFAGRYFAPRYFAPRYFAKRGAAPAPAESEVVLFVVPALNRGAGVI